MTSIEIIDNLEGFTRLKPHWNALLKQSEVDTIFLTFEWQFSWWKIFGGDRKLFILVVRENNDIIGILPLMMTAGKGRRDSQKLELIGTPNNDYADLIACDKTLAWEAIRKYLFDHKDQWTHLEITQVPESSSTIALWQNPPGGCSRHTFVIPIETCLAYVYEGREEDRGQYKIKLSHSMKSAFANFAKMGGVVLERITDCAVMHNTLNSVFQLHVNRWDETPTPSKFLDERQRRFYHDLVDAMGPDGRICFLRVTNNNLPVAFSFNFEYDGQICFYTVAINKYFQKNSPGSILFVMQAEKLIREGFILDYSRGAHQYKNLFTNRISANYQINLYSDIGDCRRAHNLEKFRHWPPVQKALRNKTLQVIKLKVQKEFETRGPKGIALRALAKFSELFRKYIFEYREFYVFKNNPEFCEEVKPLIEVETRRMGIESLAEISTFYGVDEGSRKYLTFKNRFEKNAICVAAYRGCNIVSVVWALFHEDVHAELGLSLEPGPNEAILSDAWTSLMYRGNRIIRHISSRIVTDLNRQGIGVLGGIARANKPSLKAYKSIGFKKIKTIRRFKIFNLGLTIK